MIGLGPPGPSSFDPNAKQSSLPTSPVSTLCSSNGSMCCSSSNTRHGAFIFSVSPRSQQARGQAKPSETSACAYLPVIGFGSWSETEQGNSPAPTTTSSQGPGSPPSGSRRDRHKLTRTPNDGFGHCATNSWTGRSSGTNTSSNNCFANTSSTTTRKGHTEESANERLAAAETSHRSDQTTRSNDTPPAPDSSTNTDRQPDPTATQARPTSTRPESHRNGQENYNDQPKSARTNIRHVQANRLGCRSRPHEADLVLGPDRTSSRSRCPHRSRNDSTRQCRRF